MKLSGILLDSQFWFAYRETLSKYLSINIFIFHCLRNILDITFIKNSLFSFFSFKSRLWYYPVSELQICWKNIHPTKNVVRIIYFASSRDHCKLLFQNEIIPLPSLYIINTLIEIQKNTSVCISLSETQTSQAVYSAILKINKFY